MTNFLFILLLFIGCKTPTDGNGSEIILPDPSDVCENNYDETTQELISCDDDCEEHNGSCYNTSDLSSFADFRSCGVSYDATTSLFDIGVQEWSEGGRLMSLTFYALEAYEDILTCIPQSIGNFTSLTRLSFFDGAHQVTSIPQSIGNLNTLEHLHLSNNQINTLPETIGALDNLEILDLSHNQLTSLPESIGELSSLSYLNLSHNQLTSLPESIEGLDVLWYLNLSHNELTSIPEETGNLSSLWSLYLNSNQITSLPSTICNLSENGIYSNAAEGCDDQLEDGYGGCLEEGTFTYWCELWFEMNGGMETADGSTLPNYVNYNLCDQLETDANGNYIDPNNDNLSEIILSDNNLCGEYHYDCIDGLDQQNEDNCGCDGITNGNGVDLDNDSICDDNDECVGEYDCDGICNGNNQSCYISICLVHYWDPEIMGDNIWSEGEPFIDCNDNQSICEDDDDWDSEMGDGVWNSGEIFYDCNEDQSICENDYGLTYTSNIDIAGFQFFHSDCIAGVSGGNADLLNFQTGFSDIALVSFSFMEGPITDDAGTLINLEGEITDDCLFNFIFSDSNAESVDYRYNHYGCQNY